MLTPVQADPYSYEGDAKWLANADANSEISTTTAVSTAEYVALESKYRTLEQEFQKLSIQVRSSQAEVESLQAKLDEANQKLAAASTKPENAADDLEVDPEIAALSEDAKRAKLRRLCGLQADGSSKVPMSVHLQWKNGGKNERERLMKIACATKFERDCTRSSEA